jgi:peroxiredoxin Q/BCP
VTTTPSTPSAINCQVPHFTAAMTGTTEFNLIDFLGKKIILYFYPKDNTPGCTTESIAFREIHQELLDANAVVFGISRDSLR